ACSCCRRPDRAERVQLCSVRRGPGDYARNDHESHGCGDLLVTNVFGGRGENRILADVSGMIADAFEVTGNEHEVDVTVQLLRMACHSIDQLSAYLRVHFIKRV